jgi:beta-carotene ketolase (CrtW type)
LNGRFGPPSAAAIRADLQPHLPWVGLAWALALLMAWTASLIATLLMPLAAPGLSGAVLLPLILLRTVLQTGLFIIGHDAMHGSLLPGSPRWNDRLGRLSLWLYACLPWDSCRRNHRRHHQAPASRLDPDHHGSQRPGPLRWYRRFMGSYLTPAQMRNLLASWLLALLLLQPCTAHPLTRLLLFWTLPLLLSSLQLFVFGTYLPHRQAPGRSDDRHRAASLAWPRTLSLFACYHFGYHWEHHRHPQLPWYRLPAARRLMTVPPAGASRLALPQASR